MIYHCGGIFRIMGCPPEFWVRIIGGVFKDDAQAWWQSARETHFDNHEHKDIT